MRLPAAVRWALLFALAHGQGASIAASFVPVAQARSVAIESQLLLLDTQTSLFTPVDFSDRRDSAAGEFGATELLVGMASSLPEGRGLAQGTALQTSWFAGETIGFDGRADVGAFGSSDERYQASGFADATVLLSFEFDVTSITRVRLTMDSSVVPGRDDDYRFLLTRAGGPAVWQETVRVDAAGDASRSFSQSLVLDPGRHVLTLALHAFAMFDPAIESSGRSVAMVQLAAVPEPQAFALIVLGLAGLGWHLRRRRA